MTKEQVIEWIKNGIDTFIPEYVFFYQQALSEFDKNPDSFDATVCSNAEELRKNPEMSQTPPPGAVAVSSEADDDSDDQII